MDRGPTGVSYTLPKAGGWKLVKGQLKPFDCAMKPPILLVCVCARVWVCVCRIGGVQCWGGKWWGESRAGGHRGSSSPLAVPWRRPSR